MEARVSLRSRVARDRARGEREAIAKAPLIIAKVVAGAVSGMAIIAMLAVM